MCSFPKQKYKTQTQVVLFPDLRENQKVLEMGSWLVGNWPSFDPHNFSQLRPNDPSKKTPITYHPTHERTLPPPDQVISSEAKNILLRQFYQRSDEKLRPKRAAPENLAPEQEFKHPRASGPSSSEPPP